MATQLNITRQQYENLRGQGLSKEEILEMGSGTTVKESDILGKSAGVLDSIFGGGTIGEAIGTKIAKATVPSEQRRFVEEGPTGKQIAGDVLRTGALFTPVGRIAGATSKVASPFLKKGAGLLGKSVAGGVSGAAFDVGEGLRQEESPDFLATGLGVGLPPAMKAMGMTTRSLGALGSELLGATTGTGGKTIKEFFGAIRAGGDRAKQATKSMRGKISEDVVVQDATLALDNVVQTRSKQYAANFRKAIDNKQQLNVQPIHNKVDEMLASFNVKKGPDGLDFSRSVIRNNKQAQSEINDVVDTMADFGTKPGDRSPYGVDLLKQSIDDIYTESSRVRAFTTAIRKETRKVLSDVKGYDKVQKEYETKTKLIKEMRNSLSLKDSATVDTKLRKLLSSLRQQQGFKDELVKQLDEEAGTFITAQIAGQQLKEALPVGMWRQLALAGGATGAVITGSLIQGMLPMLQAVAIMSPRLVGEMVRGLGISAKIADDVAEAIISSVPKGTAGLPTKALQLQTAQE